ncbi:MAG: hypothetical protein V3R63_02165, partial [Alphaproteobacteria bacterium]
MTAPAPGRDRWFDWDRDSIERFWRDAFALDLTPARLQRRMGPHLVAGLAARAAPPANVLLLGDRDPIFAETLLGAGFRVARAPLARHFVRTRPDIVQTWLVFGLQIHHPQIGFHGDGVPAPTGREAPKE